MFSVTEVEENTRLKTFYRAAAIMLTNTECKDSIWLKALCSWKDAAFTFAGDYLSSKWNQEQISLRDTNNPR